MSKFYPFLKMKATMTSSTLTAHDIIVSDFHVIIDSFKHSYPTLSQAIFLFENVTSNLDCFIDKSINDGIWSNVWNVNDGGVTYIFKAEMITLKRYNIMTMNYILSVIDDGDELIKISVNNKGYDAYFNHEDLEMAHYEVTDNSRLTRLELAFRPLPFDENYRISMFYPYDVIDSNNMTVDVHKFTPKGDVYERMKIGKNKPQYSYRVIAWAAMLDNHEELEFNMTRSRYNQKVKAGNLYVVDHINRNPKDNKQENLRIITSRENNKRIKR